MFFVLGSKKHSIYSVFWAARSKNTSIYAVFIMLQELFFHAKVTKRRKITVQWFGYAVRVRGGGRLGGGWAGGRGLGEVPKCTVLS